MSARKAKRPDLAIAHVRTQWIPQIRERVRHASDTTQSAIMHGTADVLYIREEHDGTIMVTVSRDPGPYGEPRWTRWPLTKVRRVTAARAPHDKDTTPDREYVADGWTLPPCGHLECADHLHSGCEPTRSAWERWRDGGAASARPVTVDDLPHTTTP